MLEVELKAKVDKESIGDKLLEEGAIFVRQERQIDTYFSHPCWNFKLRDEVLRVRQAGNVFYLTFKGPRIDNETKTREEIEVEVKGDIFSLLDALGFMPSKKVIKQRKIYQWQDLILSLDEVENLGSFLEIEGKRMEDKDKILNFFNRLGIKNSSLIKKSYLELIKEEGEKNE